MGWDFTDEESPVDYSQKLGPRRSWGAKQVGNVGQRGKRFLGSPIVRSNMTYRYTSAFVVSVLSFFAICRGQQAVLPAAEGGTAPANNLTEVLELSQQTLVFEPTREDFTVGMAVFSVMQLPSVNLEGVRINGAVPTGSYLYLKQVGKNRFELPALKIEYSKDAAGGPLYLALKVWFEGISNQGDPFYYEKLPDRYALLTYCTNEADDPAKVNARWGANRAVTLREFKEKLAMPVAVKLNREPLRAGGGYPMVNDAYGQLGPADMTALQELVRGRDEKHIYAITAIDSDRANVHTSVNDATQYFGTRIYKAVKVGAAWQIESVENMKNGF